MARLHMVRTMTFSSMERCRSTRWSHRVFSLQLSLLLYRQSDHFLFVIFCQINSRSYAPTANCADFPTEIDRSLPLQKRYNNNNKTPSSTDLRPPSWTPISISLIVACFSVLYNNTSEPTPSSLTISRPSSKGDALQSLDQAASQVSEIGRLASATG